MRARSALVGFGAVLATMVAGACGSLDNGAINIIDAQGGGGSGAGGAGTGGGSAGGSGGAKAGSGGAKATGGDAGAPSDGGGQAGAGGDVTTSGGSAGASTGGQGQAGDVSGAGAGVGGEAGSSSGGCSKGTDCTGATPICDPALLQCRACTAAAECAADDATTPYCRAGTCVSCTTDANCPAASPVCGVGNKCRTCSTGSECGSLACNAKGACATATQVVYALAQTGVFAADCGAADRPCGSLATAATKLSTARPYLVLVATQSAFNEGATLPANIDISVFGNHVRVAPYDGTSAFIINGGNVVFDDVVAAATTSTTAGGNSAIACSGSAKLKFFKGAVSNSNTSYGSVGLLLSGCNADVQQATFTLSQTGIASSCPDCVGGLPTQTLTVERTLFQGNKNAIAFDGATFLIRNNLFLRNGNASYVDIIGIRGTSGIFSFNTMVGNENNCSYEGGLVSCEGGAMACGTFSSNLSWNNMLNAGGTPCFDQVYYSQPALSNSLSETTWPGTGNVSADPKFVDAAKDNYTPGAGSPALNKGSTSTVAGLVPTVDYYGNPRGAAPDIGAIEAQ